MADPIVSGLSAYGGKMRNEIIGQVFRKLEDQGVTILTDVKGETKFPKLSIAKGLKPYTGTHSPADVMTLTDRALSPKLAQFDFLIEPLKLHGKWFGDMQAKNAVDAKLPFEAFAMQSVVDKIVDELVASTLGFGDTAYVGADNAIKVCDGFLKRVIQLIAGGKAAITTGAISGSNAVTKLELLYTTGMNANQQWYNKPVTQYVSHATFLNYITHYRTLFSNDPANWSANRGEVYLNISAGKCKVKPVDWLGTSGRVIMAPVENMLVGTDAISDLNKVKIVDDVYTQKCGVTFVIDTQIIDKDAVWYNEQS